MDDDSRYLLRGVGCLPTSLGALVIALGAFYALMEWRYGGAVLAWGLMWGLMLVGLGLAVMSTGRRWMAFLAIAACAASAYLVFRWEKNIAPLEEWSSWLYPADSIGVALGLALIIASFWRRSQ